MNGDEPPGVIEADGDLSALIDALQPLCDLGQVCDFTFRDGTRASAVLVGVSTTGLIVDHWDGENRRPAGDPYVLELVTIRRVVIP
jgi:hypothetical protein